MKRILCYGDSLTAGYYRYGSEFSPYGKTLERYSQIEVDVVGMSGWTSDQMVQCANLLNNEDFVDFVADGLNRLLISSQYDLICLMAGTNDLGTGIPVEEIVENVSTLVHMCLLSAPRITVALLTVPSNGAENYSAQALLRREQVNSAIANLAAINSNRVILIDSSSILPNPGRYPEVATSESEAWDTDLLHLSPKGSERLGKFVFDSLVSYGLLH